jgi:hypothetical protein
VKSDIKNQGWQCLVPAVAQGGVLTARSQRRTLKQMRQISIVKEETMVSGQVKFNVTIHTPSLTYAALLGTCQSTLVLQNYDRSHARTDGMCEENKRLVSN